MLENIDFHWFLNRGDGNWLSHHLIKDAVNHWRKNINLARPGKGEVEDEDYVDNENEDDADDEDDQEEGCEDDEGADAEDE